MPEVNQNDSETRRQVSRQKVLAQSLLMLLIVVLSLSKIVVSDLNVP